MFIHNLYSCGKSQTHWKTSQIYLRGLELKREKINKSSRALDISDRRAGSSYARRRYEHLSTGGFAPWDQGRLWWVWLSLLLFLPVEKMFDPHAVLDRKLSNRFSVLWCKYVLCLWYHVEFDSAPTEVGARTCKENKLQRGSSSWKHMQEAPWEKAGSCCIPSTLWAYFHFYRGKTRTRSISCPWVVPSAVVSHLVTSSGPLVGDSDICWLSVATEVPDAVLNVKSWYFQSQKTVLLQTTVSVALSAVMTENELLILHWIKLTLR